MDIIDGPQPAVTLASLDDGALLQELAEAAGQLRSAEARVARAAREAATRCERRPRPQSLASVCGFRNAKALLVAWLSATPTRVTALLGLGEATSERQAFSVGRLPAERPLLAAALDAGRLSLDQALSIHAGLPRARSARDAAAEGVLVAEACGTGESLAEELPAGHWLRRLPPHLLRAQAHLWSAVIDPDGTQLSADRQFELRSFRLLPLPDGSWRLTGHAPALEGAAMQAVLDAACSPRRPQVGDRGDAGGACTPETAGSRCSITGRTMAERRAEHTAFDLVSAALHAVGSPDTSASSCNAPGGGRNVGRQGSAHEGLRRGRGVDPNGGGGQGQRLAPVPRIIVTVSEHALSRRPAGVGMGGVEEAAADAEAAISSAFAVAERCSAPLPVAALDRLSCTADVAMLLVDGQGQPLRLGRTRRLFSSAQRRALVARDKKCRAPGCDAPPSFCEAHHATQWTAGGTTDVSNGLLLCSFHHHEVHRGRLVVRPVRRRPPERRHDSSLRCPFEVIPAWLASLRERQTAATAASAA